ncbi:MAG: riboflavin synthase [Pseudohongiellaceae bacterium]
MFTGIIEAIGTVKTLQEINSEWRLTLDVSSLDMSDVKLGDSIAVNGCCLTVVDMTADSFAADVSNETLRCTSLSLLKTNGRVNLEKAMQATDRFGGHIVSGHVDGVGKLIESSPEGQSVKLVFEVPDELCRYIAAKGSICIDGTSLTVNEVSGKCFAINVIPHTQTETIIGDYQVGRPVNLEVDLVARYLERLMSGAGMAGSEKITKDYLAEHGFSNT